MSLSSGLIAAVALTYMAIMFAIAFYGDRYSASLLAVQIEDLLNLSARFVGEDRARQSFIRFAYRQGKGFNPSLNANGEWIAHTERLLAGVLGTSSTRAVVKAAIEGRDMQLEDVVRIADEASEVLQFNRALLQGAIENITQGISVVDQSLLSLIHI